MGIAHDNVPVGPSPRANLVRRNAMPCADRRGEKTFLGAPLTSQRIFDSFVWDAILLDGMDECFKHLKLHIDVGRAVSDRCPAHQYTVTARRYRLHSGVGHAV